MSEKEILKEIEELEGKIIIRYNYLIADAQCSIDDINNNGELNEKLKDGNIELWENKIHRYKMKISEIERII